MKMMTAMKMKSLAVLKAPFLDCLSNFLIVFLTFNSACRSLKLFYQLKLLLMKIPSGFLLLCSSWTRQAVGV